MKQHYLPQCYLREFCNKDGKIHTLDLTLLKHKRKVFDQARFSSEICRSIDFYTIKSDFNKTFKHLSNIDPLFLENAFHTYERKYPELVQKIKDRQKALIRADACLFLYALVDFKIRNPYFRENVVNANKDKIFREMGDGYKNEVAKLDLGEFPHLTNESLINIWDEVSRPFLDDKNYAQNAHISSMVLRHHDDDNVQDEIVNRLLQFQWFVFESKSLFITNDNPGFSLDQNKKRQNTRFNGQFYFFMPITPSLCFGVSSVARDLKYGQNSTQKTLSYVPATGELIKLINEDHLTYHNQFVFAGSKGVIEQIAIRINELANLND